MPQNFLELFRQISYYYPAYIFYRCSILVVLIFSDSYFIGWHWHLFPLILIPVLFFLVLISVDAGFACTYFIGTGFYLKSISILLQKEKTSCVSG